jgi:hypothetical protein
MAADMEISEVTLIGDALGLIQMVREETEPALVVSNIVAIIQDRLAEHGFVRPFWCSRDNNHLAHSLASFAKTSLDETIVWDSPPPLFLSTVTGRFPVP